MRMKMKWQKALGGIALASLLVGASAGAFAQDRDYDTWDTDRSGGVDYNEWSNNYDYNSTYSNWDTDRDGALTSDEWGQGMYNTYDRDRDGMLSEEEYDRFDRDTRDDGWRAN